MPSAVDHYLARLDELSDGAAPVFHTLDTTRADLGPVTAILYQDVPAAGLLTGLTYGLSLAEHPEWTLRRRELCVTVRSGNAVWALAAAFLAEQLRGACPFAHGDTIDFGDRIAPESGMSAFTVYEPSLLAQPGYSGIDVGDVVIDIVGCYPVYEVERRFIRETGFEAFWELDWDPYDVTRPPAL